MSRSVLVRSLSLGLAILGTILVTAGTANAALVFDNISNFQNAVSGAGVTSTSSTPNTFMGDGYVLASGTTAITGFDIYPVNLSGTAYTGLKINIFVWDNVNVSGTVNAATPAFSNLLANYTLTTTGSYASGYYFPFEGSPVGSDPGIALASPLAISDTTVGITFNIQGTTDGTTYANANSLTTLISYGTAPTVGTQLFSGYYRNAASEADGNFTSALRSLSGLTNQSLAVRVYGTPEPASMLLALAGLGLFARRRNRA